MEAKQILPYQYGHWIALKDLGTIKNIHYVLCQCRCGKKKSIALADLKRGKTTQCSDCAKIYNKPNLKHGKRDSPEYAVWNHMKDRCYNSKNKFFRDYGGRGITVCARWLDKEKGFENFYADMGSRPSIAHSIDRYPNNNGNYEPSNCRWATDKEQQHNTRKFNKSKIK